MIEVWADLRGFEGTHQISTLGRVRRKVDGISGVRREWGSRKQDCLKRGMAARRLGNRTIEPDRPPQWRVFY